MDMGDSARGALFQALPVFGHARAFFLLPPLGFDSIGLMGHIRRIGLVLIIIAFFPYLAMAHEGEVHFSVNPTALPGERGYAWDIVSEWFSVNLFTLSAKGKQEKKLALAEERLAEFMALLATGGDTRGTLNRYRDTLFDAADMARKIVIIDGGQIAIAEKLEERTRLHEAALIGLLESVSGERQAQVMTALSAARLNNEDTFIFMARNYQFNEADIKKHGEILQEHIELVEREIATADLDRPRNDKVRALIIEAKKHQSAGLNAEGYGLVKKAKNIIYSQIFNF